ncbi:hypothetical protein [Gordonia neofelifaecis]|uniref:Beta-lactamase n=1 Tax=Gordonia neofelifaecis NRRL B-59395 TaxID=644548 RepID=F1YF31_9ACTN|nr:hypothetical protein [Gordonia neofelifaecis]EGD56371.1 hypothetical protein SCNU_02422 [Gordonia neofelifaecis NRRL B-59395]
MTAAGTGVATAAPPLPLPNVLPSIPGLPGPPPPPVDLGKSFAKLSRSVTKAVPGRLGVAVTPTGSGEPAFFGTVKTARAWSTLKAPVAVAAERAHVKDLQPMETKSIRDSDNASAEAIWDSLGSTRQAIDAVSAVLREGGDSRTQISSELSSPASYPGATQWATTDQSVFAANLPCLNEADHVVQNMSAVGPNQKWGLAKAKKNVQTSVKGGWGPVSENTGKYVVRQLAVVTTPRGTVGVSLVAVPASGSFEDGTAMLTRVGDWVQRNLVNLPAGQCAPPIGG